MADDFKYDVFLSHSSKDKDIVRAVAERLRDDGLRVWFDEWKIRAGDSIPAKIDEGLEHSRVVAFCMSENAFGSEWVTLERYTPQFRDPQNRERRFIPLRLDKAPIKGSLAQFSYINWLPEAQEQEYVKLLEACQPTFFSSDGRRAVSICLDNTLRVREATSGRCLYVLEGHTARVTDVNWRSDGAQIVSISLDNTLRVWEVESGRCLSVFTRTEP